MKPLRSPQSAFCGRAEHGRRYAPFEVKLPFGGLVRYDGRGWVLVDAPSPPADGIYGNVEVKDGYIETLSPADSPAYIAPPCGGLPGPCGDAGDGGGSGVSVAPDSANLTRLTGSGLLTRLYYNAKDGAAVSGSGTAASPLEIGFAAPSQKTSIYSETPDLLSVAGEGTAALPYRLAHAKPGSAGKKGAFTIDAGGHVTGYEEPSGSGTSGVAGIIITPGDPAPLTMETKEGVVQLGLPSFFTEPAYFYTDTHRIAVDFYGRVTGIAPAETHETSRYSKVFLGSFASLEFSITTGRVGKLRGAYKGDLNLSLSGKGLQPLPSGFAGTVDGTPAELYAAVESGAAVGIEFLSTDKYEPGTHTVSITFPSAVSGPGILDISVCQ